VAIHHDSVRIARAKADVAKVVSRSMRALSIGIGSRSVDEIRAGFAENSQDAPMWVHAVMRLGQAKVVATEKAPETGRASLNVVVVQAAGSVAAWEQQAENFRLATAPKPVALIDVPVKGPNDP
jgi:hypothetical protein